MSDRRTRRLVLAATSLGSGMAFLDMSVVFVALPAMRDDLQLGLSGQQWTALSYTLPLAASYLAVGAVSDRVGLRRAFLAGTVVFALASLLVGAAPDGSSLYAARAAQGVAAAVLSTTSLALLRVAWGDEAGRAIGLWASLTTAATVAGPPLGGLVVELVSWRWIFLANLPLAMVVLLLMRAAGRSLAAAADGGEREPLPDALSLLLATVTVGLVVAMLVEWGSLGARGVAAVASAAVVAAMATALRQRRGARALVPGSLLRDRVFVTANAATFLIYASLGAMGFFSSIYLQSPAVGYSAFEAGLLQVPTSVVLVLLAPTFGRLADRHGARRFLVGGALLLAAACLLLATVDSATLDTSTSAPWIEVDGIDLLLPGMLLAGVALGGFVSPITATALRAAPERQAGVASAVNHLAARGGSLVAVALIGVVVGAAFASVADGAGREPFASANDTPRLERADVEAWRWSMLGAALLAAAGAAVAGIGLRGTDTTRHGDNPHGTPTTETA